MNISSYVLSYRTVVETLTAIVDKHLHIRNHSVVVFFILDPKGPTSQQILKEWLAARSRSLPDRGHYVRYFLRLPTSPSSYQQPFVLEYELVRSATAFSFRIAS